MSDDPQKQGKADRSRVAANETYEVGYFAKKHGISREEAQALIDQVGNDRAKLDAAVSKSASPKQATTQARRQNRDHQIEWRRSVKVSREPRAPFKT